ncbi:MAG: DMT family transporter [Syntrophobacteraceae bacterium]|nr:DMT family transporter [Desulfobacteraceae bacterium]
MYVAEISALAAALCWSCGGLFAITPARAFGALAFNRIRITMAFFMLAAVALFTGGWYTLSTQCCVVLAISAIVGVLIGDSFFYVGLRRLGPRRSSIIFTTNAPMAAVMGYFILDERLPASTTIGIALITLGVFLAVFHGTTATQKHSFEKVEGSMTVGVIAHLLSAFCQAAALIIARPVLTAGVDTIAASALRVGTGALALWALLLFRPSACRAQAPVTRSLLGQTAMNSVIGMGLGMTLLIHALAHGPAGLVSTLSATSPILVLPVLWAVTRERPSLGAWIGAILAVAGVGCIFNS